MMNTAYLGLGSNLGDRAFALREGLRRLGMLPALAVKKLSSVYETKPVGLQEQPDFLNMAARVETSLAPRALLAECLRIETELGRVRRELWGPRTLDIDVLWYDGLTYYDSELVLPHPRMKERGFVLVPLAELAPDLEIDGAPVAQRAAQLPDQGLVRLGLLDSIQA